MKTPLKHCLKTKHTFYLLQKLGHVTSALAVFTTQIKIHVTFPKRV